MKIHSTNEWDKLRSVIVGSATGSNWPDQDPVYQQESLRTSWIHNAPPSGPVHPDIVAEANEDLSTLCSILVKLGVQVLRPVDHDFATTGGMYNYCPRDRLLVADDVLIDVCMMYPCRDQETQYLPEFVKNSRTIKMPRNRGMILDAANICRLGDDWLFLLSRSGNELALDWLRSVCPNKRIHACNFYAGVHIDSTITALRPGLVMLNASRVNEKNMPAVFESWEKIWISQCQSRDFIGYPYASDWIGMNMLSVDTNTVIIDEIQTDIIKILETKGFTVIPTAMRHCRTLGGGPHCVTLDLWRQND